MWSKALMILLIGQPILANQNQGILQQYIVQGLKNNLAVQHREFSLQKSLEALKEAKGMFFPSVSIEARYSRAGGGRLIEIPVGDLANPIFGSLNALFKFHGIDAGFPTDIPNDVFPFLREREQETKVRIIQPLFQPAIYHNYKIQSSLAKVNQAEMATFQRQLIADIKSAYFNYAKSLKIVELLEETQVLLEENLRVSENLIKNGKATEDVIFRARAELADLDQKKAEAEKNRQLAKTYFNFLINRDLGSPIEVSDETPESPEAAVDFDYALQNALQHRKEFEQIKQVIEATSHQVGLAKSNFLPEVTAVLDVGIQGEDYGFGGDYDYWMASLVLSWTLFDGNRNQAKKVQAQLEKKKLEVQRTELKKKIQMEVQNVFHALRATRSAVSAAKEKELSARKSFGIVAKKYEYGTASQIEYLDARTTYTNAAINHILARYDYLIQMAKFERVSALSELDKYLE